MWNKLKTSNAVLMALLLAGCASSESGKSTSGVALDATDKTQSSITSTPLDNGTTSEDSSDDTTHTPVESTESVESSSSSESSTSSDEEVLPSSNIRPAVSRYSVMEPTTLSAGVANLTGAMLQVAGKAQDNVIISGYSALSAMSLVGQYAQGTTRAEIEQAFSKIDNAELSELSAKMPIEVGQMFLVDERRALGPSNKEDFIIRDLTDDSIVDFVNNFCSEKTHGMIKELITEPYKSACAVVLDSIYFKNAWVNPFDATETYKETFHGTDGNSEVDFMHQIAHFAVDKTNSIIRLPYQKGNAVMDIVYGYDDLDKAYKTYINTAVKSDGNFASINTALALPKFTAEATCEITDAYRMLGIEGAFAPGDFDGLIPESYIDKVRQKAVIIVDEEGTEASAITEISMVDNAMPVFEEPYEVTLDKPFLYVIRSLDTNMILFVGTINNLQ